jgi:serine/threonine protein kinase
MVMELLRGETLGAKLLRDERLSLEETAALLLPVVSAVGTAHALGIVHRDLKPDNLFLIEGGGVKVLDFGIAKLAAERYLQDGPSAMLTESGSMLGTPCYMAPEQASGEHPVDHRADVWSFGVILYECLSGMRPIEGENLPQVVARLMSAGIMPLERIAPELPGEVTGLVKQMLTREVGRRTPSLVEVGRTLGRFTSVKVPEFAPPSGVAGSGSPQTMESARSRPKVVHGPGADPQGPTMLSSPPVNSSLLQIAKVAPAQNRSLVFMAIAAVLLAAVAWLAFDRRPAAVPVSTAELPMLPQAPERVAAPPVAAAPGPSAVVPVTSGESRFSSSAPAPFKARPKASPPNPAAKSSTDTNEKSLFSGRK